ncbi:hypothetical protein DMA12_33075 [Amycolatopsis balhimycina DSM 5908]|uniref:Uncharacterized protein n=1 Tax=Amycolatopsis balhimycina DSM 5908 TaxID=1081091 RepID=A0A428W5L8_AMYBA|nr:hypothetical protein DMA12_33075 [Amycolatopsis balhimycina DSM 5908]
MNGIGRVLLSPTTRDESGAHFKTAWISILLPLIPIGRYYLQEVSSLSTGVRTTTRYHIIGRSRLVGAEVVRTYLYCWLIAPLVGAGPAALLLSQADELADSIGVFGLIALFLITLTASITLLSFGTNLARSRFFTPRTVILQDKPPTYGVK